MYGELIIENWPSIGWLSYSLYKKMADEQFRKLLEERGWTIFRGGNQIVISKGDYRITLKPSLDVPGKVLMLKGFLSNEAGPKYEFFDSKDAAFRDVEGFIRQQSKPEITQSILEVSLE